MKEMICPNCGSQQIEYSSMTTHARKTITGLGIPEMYFCPKCGYEGSVILEIDPRHIKGMHFKKENYSKKPFKLPDKHSQDVLRPVFTIVIMLFLFISALAFFPHSQTEKKYYTDTFEPLQQSDIPFGELTRISVINVPELGGPVIMEKTPTGEVILEAQSVELPQMDTKTGLEGVTGFFFPLFVVIFVIGFVGLMIAKHYERSLKFI